MERFTNNAKSTLAVGIGPGDTSVTLNSGDGALWPVLSVGEECYTTISTTGVLEIVRVTARAGDVLTVVRGQQDTTALTWPSGSSVELRLTAATLNRVMPVVYPPETGRLLITNGTTTGWAKYLVNDEGDILTDNQFQIVHENDLGGSDVAHADYTASVGGVHSVVFRTYASASARTTDTSLTADDIGKVALQTSDSTSWCLVNNSPVTWVELSNSEVAIFPPAFASLTTQQDDWLPTGWSDDGTQTIFVDLPSNDVTITGLADPVNGRPLQLLNNSTAYSLTLTHDDPASSNGQRFNLPGGTPLVIPPRSGGRLVYSADEAAWIMVHGRAWPKQVGNTSGTVAAGNDFRFNKNAETPYDIWYEWEPHLITTLVGGDPFVAAPVGTGTINNASYPVTDALNDGSNLSARFRSTATANHGYRIYTENLNLVLFEGAPHVFICRFQITGALTNRTIRMGFHDAVNVTDAVDGIYVEYSPSTIKGKVARNSARTTTATTFAPTLNTWYTAVITTDGVDAAYFELYDPTDPDGLVWADYLADSEGANIPYGIARAYAVAVVATEASTAAANIGAVSYIGFGSQQAWTKKFQG